MNTYPATVRRVIDGDTVDLDIDLGFSIRITQRVRLAGINTAEKDTPAGKETSAWVKQWLDTHGPALTVQTHRREKYGRYLATITTADGQALNQALIDAGRAAPYDGTGPRPVPTPLQESP
ncbi:thermonuclease family protein [Streptomyces sp. NPDC088707]|uniref:thermonuclease family protein n=1 Tax=Streptomyces sp. NPDC088707 TaxID=3365871 RepID=UPI0038286D5A